MPNTSIYLDTYTLQSDSRIRLPKSAIENLDAEPGKTKFKILYDPTNHALILKMCNSDYKEDSSKNAK